MIKKSFFYAMFIMLTLLASCTNSNKEPKQKNGLSINNEMIQNQTLLNSDLIIVAIKNNELNKTYLTKKISSKYSKLNNYTNLSLIIINTKEGSSAREDMSIIHTLIPIKYLSNTTNISTNNRQIKM